jgi:hypothetical protein
MPMHSRHRNAHPTDHQQHDVMKWVKHGLIYALRNDHPWMKTHTQLPIAYPLDEQRLRIYFGTRDAQNRTLPTYIEVATDCLKDILYIHDKPVMALGELGAFDDSGVMPSWIVRHGNLNYLYYIGWNQGVTVGYRNSIGLAVSDNDGHSFTRLYKGPILDRTITEPHFCAAPCVLIDNGIWRMWYLSCVKWAIYQSNAEPFYHIKYAESEDGVHWRRRGIVCIDFKSPDEAGIVRASVIKRDGQYCMWYSYRSYKDYRINRNTSYRIGYAESDDGLVWTRMDEIVGIDVEEQGWDSQMIAYPYVYRHKDQLVMLYNGNGFGQSGIGYAVLIDSER